MAHARTFNYEAATVIDGLVFFSDGNNRDVRAGGVTAMNVTITEMSARFEQAVQDIAAWRKRCREDPTWILVEGLADIDRAKQSGGVGLIMGWQNAKPFGESLERIALFHELGLRVVQLTYNEANLIGDGCLETRNGGLSRYGVQVVEEMNRVGIAIDASHCAEQTCLDACKHSSRPVLLTHANANGVIKRPRNKSDEVLKAVAATGGVIGCSIHGYLNWRGDPARQSSLEDFVANVKYIGDLVGYEHVGIGTDFPSVDTYEAVRHVMVMSRTKYPASGGDLAAAFGDVMEARYPKETPTPAQFPVLAQALEDGGLTDAQIAGVLGKNFYRAFGECWKSN
ncbi:dipeptidase [Parapusillimonas granuli]|uniref:Dipeptidase n=1 Tax=Parapusillimonas granuli TaxID=380911 RepID=A0A853G2J5_9BURK|nr:dipeptidase [Parapusillimonas granuli]MBB5217446.1 membrane dipeptidase [Parapusillimonas granuli]MEB2401890.1 dipeptidase [Alcaligenaceae bacterium]NYT50062.1 dipeptidase [Parapusillimonas granuli]